MKIIRTIEKGEGNFGSKTTSGKPTNKPTKDTCSFGPVGNEEDGVFWGGGGPVFGSNASAVNRLALYEEFAGVSKSLKLF